MFQSAAMNFSLWMLLLIFLNILQSVSALKLKLKLLSLPVKCWNVEFLLDSELILIPKRFPPAKDTDHLCYQLDFNMKHLPLLKNFATSKERREDKFLKEWKSICSKWTAFVCRLQFLASACISCVLAIPWWVLQQLGTREQSHGLNPNLVLH